MSNQSIVKSIIKAYEKYINDELIEDFQHVFESNILALEGIERGKMTEIKEIINDIEYARFLFPKDEQPKKVKDAVTRLKVILEID